MERTTSGWSLGNLCLSGAIGRFVGPGQVQQADATGSIEIAVDLLQMPQPMSFATVMPGDVWSFQAWFRDSFAGQPVSNFSEGLSISFH